MTVAANLQPSVIRTWKQPRAEKVRDYRKRRASILQRLDDNFPYLVNGLPALFTLVYHSGSCSVENFPVLCELVL
jgi:hypothetical protein